MTVYHGLMTSGKTPTMSNSVVLPLTKQYHVIGGSQAVAMSSCMFVRNFLNEMTTRSVV